MTILKRGEVSKKLLSKGFRISNNDHQHLILYEGDKRTRIRTKISQGSKNIDNYLINQMSIQLHLEKSEFIDLVDCKFSGFDYLKKLKEQNFIN